MFRIERENYMSLELIQIIEDEPVHARLLDHCLRQAEFRTNVAHDGETGLKDVTRLKPAAVLLDVMLPKMSGHDVCLEIRRNRATQHTPLIMISALGCEQDRLAGFDVGADDYVTKPFSPREVVSRVEALLRRSRLQGPERREVPGSSVVIRGHCFTVSLSERDVTVSPEELVLLQLLTARKGQIVAQEELLATLWNDSRLLQERKLLALVRDVHRKIENAGAGAIEIIPAIGYRFVSHPR